MKETPILYSAPMVRAYFAGLKTQTRRIVKPQPEDVGYGRHCIVRPYCTGTEWPMAYYEMRGSCWNSSKPLKCPYGGPGDVLWGKETFYNDVPEEKNLEHVIYRADGECCDQIPECQCASVGKPKWRPSIFMPRWASRITQRITAVRVDRLHDISELDAKAEGADCGRYVIAKGKPFLFVPADAADEVDLKLCSYKQGYRFLWESIHGEDSWERNPWVWVIEFEKYQ